LVFLICATFRTKHFFFFVFPILVVVVVVVLFFLPLLLSVVACLKERKGMGRRGEGEGGGVNNTT
jgi:hypothetical protein